MGRKSLRGRSGLVDGVGVGSAFSFAFSSSFSSSFSFSLSSSALAALGLAGLTACSSGSSTDTPRDAGHVDAKTKDTGPAEAAAATDAATTDGPAPLTFPVPAAWNKTYPRPSDDVAVKDRLACTFKRGAMPEQTLSAATRMGSDIPIEHIVVLMQENRSFDSYLGHLGAYEAKKGIKNTIESAPDTASNPSFPADQTVDDASVPETGAPHPYTHAPQLCFFDTAHSWGAAHTEYDKGLNDGFFFSNNGNGDTGESTGGIAPAQLSGERALWWYDERDIPFHYELYSTFAMADHYHSALLGPTYPNRMYLYSSTSFGLTTNDFPDISKYPTPETPVILFDELAVRGVSFNWYSDMGASAPNIVLLTTETKRYGRNPVFSFPQFLADAKAGNLPAVSFVDGNNLNETTTGNDEHPPGDVQVGEQFVWQVVNAVTKSPNWKSTALFITYDENGGIYDHVVPPPACPPDDLAPVLTDALDKSQPGAFNQYGFRVPFVIVSPYAKKQYVSHEVYSHTSIGRFIEAKFNLPALTARDANADPFTDMFDWDDPPFLTPPTFAEPTVDQAALANCNKVLNPP